LRHFFDPRFWPFLLGKNARKLRVWLFDLVKTKGTKSRIAYIWWVLSRRNKNSLFLRISQWKKPEFLKLGFFLFLLRSKQKPLSFRIGLFLIPFLVFLATAGLIGYPLLKKYKAEKFAKTALSALENKEYSTALLTAQSAHLMQEGDIEILRSLVQAAKALMHPRYLEWSLKLASHELATQEDKLNYLRNCVFLGKNREAENWLNVNQWTESNLEELIFLRCVLLSRTDEEGKFRAFDLAQNSVNRYPKSLQLHSFLWDLCLNSGQVYLLEQGIALLRKKSEASDSIARAALRRLLMSKEGKLAERKAWAEKLWNFQDSTLEETILAMNTVYEGQNITLDKFFYMLNKESENLSDSQTRLKTIELLSQIGRKDLARELMNLETENKSLEKDLIIDKILTSMVLDDKQSIRSLLYESETLLSHQVVRFLNYMFKKRIKSPIDEDEIVDILATSRNEDLEVMQRFIFLFKDANCILRFVRELEKRSQNHSGIKYILATCYRRLNQTLELENTLLSTRMPSKVSNFSGELQTCILKVFHDQDLNSCREWAEDAVGQNPGNFSARYALALCYLKKEELGNAMLTIEQLLQQPPPRCPTQRLIGAAVLSELKGFELARKWVPTKDKDLLTSPEKKLLNQILKKLD